jgi:long-chain acyl-CoA synthetase
MTGDPILDAFGALTRHKPERRLVLASIRSATVSDIDAMATAVSGLLSESRLHAPAVVGLSAGNGPAFLAGILAVRRAGVGAVLLDASPPEAELRRVASCLGAEALLLCRSGWPDGIHDWQLSGVSAAVARPEAGFPGAPLIKVTSGSTGAPRGVCASVENVCSDEAALFATMGLRDDDVILGSIPMAHSYGFSSVALPALLRGLPIAVPVVSSPLAPLDMARQAAVTFAPTVPAYLQGLVALARPEVWPTSIRLVVSAGALLPPATAAGFREVYGQSVHCFYGASECGGICYDREGGAAERGTVGSAVEGVGVRLEPWPGSQDDEGAVVVNSRAVAHGYLPHSDSRLTGGQFRTNDRAAWAGAELRLRGRLDSLINVKGKKVDPGEVERVLVELDGVLDAIVLGVPSRPEGNETVRAVVACVPGTLTAGEIVAFCRARLAEHKVPRSIKLVTTIPRTERGKIDRGALLAHGAQGTQP